MFYKWTCAVRSSRDENTGRIAWDGTIDNDLIQQFKKNPFNYFHRVITEENNNFYLLMKGATFFEYRKSIDTKIRWKKRSRICENFHPRIREQFVSRFEHHVRCFRRNGLFSRRATLEQLRILSHDGWRVCGQIVRSRINEWYEKEIS